MFYIGEVTKYDPVRMFGFIEQLGTSGTTQFVHINNVIGRVVLRVGDIVRFEIAPSLTKPGRTEATNVRLMKRDAETGSPDAEVRQ